MTQAQDTNNAYTNPDENPEMFTRWTPENRDVYKERVYDRISQLLIEEFTKIEPYIDGNGVFALQKTFKGGKLIKRTSESDMLVVYQNDTDINKDDENLENLLINWLGYIDPDLLTLHIARTYLGEETTSDIDLATPPEFLLNAPNRSSLNLSYYISAFELTDVRLIDNVSQYLELKQNKTAISRTKLKEYIDTDFSELMPVTFTQLLEKYNKFKNDIPFYRYRTEDFFKEYGNTTVPPDYRLEKWFEEFERVKDDIPRGDIQYNTLQVYAKGTGLNNHSNNRVKFIYTDGTEEEVHEVHTSRGHNMIVFPNDSFVNGKWDGRIKHNATYDTYSPHSDHAGWCKDYSATIYGEVQSHGCRTALAHDILNPDIIGFNDLVVITSLDAIGYVSDVHDYLPKALKTIGATDPRAIDSGFFTNAEKIGFYLKGQEYNGWPNAVIKINEQIIFNQPIEHANYQWYDIDLSSISNPQGGQMIIEVAFTNDAWGGPNSGLDRNLHFNKIRVSSQTMGEVVYKVAGTGPCTSCQGILTGSEMVNENTQQRVINSWVAYTTNPEYFWNSAGGTMPWSGTIVMNIPIAEFWQGWSSDFNPGWNPRTPYALIGYGGAGQGGGTEVVTDDGPATPSAIATKSWPLRPTVTSNYARTASYIIDQLQKLYPDYSVPFYTKEEVDSMLNEIEELKAQNAVNVSKIQNLQAENDLLEEGNIDDVLDTAAESFGRRGGLVRNMRKGGRTTPKPTLASMRNGGKTNTKVIDISIDIHKDDGSITYDKNRIIDEIQKKANGKIRGNTLTQLNEIVGIMRNWIGAHHPSHTFEGWYEDPKTQQELGSRGVIPICFREVCDLQGVGWCNSVCVGAACKPSSDLSGANPMTGDPFDYGSEVNPNPNPNPGMHYTANIKVWVPW